MLFTLMACDENAHKKLDYDGYLGLYKEMGTELEVAAGKKFTIKKSVLPTTAEIEWTLDGKVISNDIALTYRIDQIGEYELICSARYGDKEKQDKTLLKVVPDMTPPEYDYIVPQFLSFDKPIDNIRWEYLTHLYLNIKFNADGKLTPTYSEEQIKTVVALAKEKKKRVMVSIYYDMEEITGMSKWQNNPKNSVLADVSKRASLIQDVTSFIATYKLDGIDFYTTEIQNLYSTPDVSSYMEGLSEFIKATRKSLNEEQIITITSTGVSNWNENGLAILGFRTGDLLPNINWINLAVYGQGGKWSYASKTNPYIFDVFNQVTDIWSKAPLLLPANKTVYLLSTYGVSYPTTGGWQVVSDEEVSQTSYIAYKDLCNQIPDITAKSQTGNDYQSGPFIAWCGFPLIEKYCEAAKKRGYKGVGMFDIASDSQDPGKSLVKKLYDTIDPQPLPKEE